MSVKAKRVDIYDHIDSFHQARYECWVVMMGVSIIDPEVRKDPYAFYRRLRAEHPVYMDPKVGWILLSKHEDVLGVLMEPETFSSADGLQEGRPVVRGQTDVCGRGVGVALTGDDDPYHALIRGLVNRAFTPKATQMLAPVITNLVSELLDKMPTGVPVDVPEAFAVALPARLIAHVLGVPEQDFPLFKRWSDTLMADESYPKDLAAEETEQFREYFRQTLADRRAHPQSDLITGLIDAASDREQTLPDDEILAIVQVLMVAGNETTTSLITNLLNLLVDRPEMWSAMRTNRTLIDVAMEETFRYESPTQLLGRRPVIDVRIGEIDIPRNSQIAALIGSAGRDETIFEESETFSLTRPATEAKRHLSFGHGAHYCIGAALARIETRILMGQLLDRYSAMERTAPSTVKTQRITLFSYSRLPVKFIA